MGPLKIRCDAVCGEPHDRGSVCHLLKSMNYAVTPSAMVVSDYVATNPNDVHENEGEHPGEVLQLLDDDVQINYKTPLGSGAFCMVYPVHLRESSGEFNTDKPPLALKKLRHGVLQNKKVAKLATADLRREAQLLSNLSHANILQVYGVRNQDENEAQDSCSFFIVLNILSDTLDSKLETWTKKRGLFERRTPHETVVSRLRDVAIGIANGLEHLHSKLIIFR
jgi:serine/threonine protein kinase